MEVPQTGFELKAHQPEAIYTTKQVLNILKILNSFVPFRKLAYFNTNILNIFCVVYLTARPTHSKID